MKEDESEPRRGKRVDVVDDAGHHVSTSMTAVGTHMPV